MTGMVILLAELLGLPLAPAETCLSPFVKRLDRPEKYLYVFCVDADAKDNDFLAVIDVDAKSLELRQDPLSAGPRLAPATKRTTSASPTTARTSGVAACFPIACSSSTWRAIPPSRSWSRPSIRPKRRASPARTRPMPCRAGCSSAFSAARTAACRRDWPSSTTTAPLSARSPSPTDAPYGYDVAINPRLNRMVTSSFTPPENYRKPLAKMDLKHFGDKLLIWDFRERKVLATLKTGPAPLECRWSLQEGANHGFTTAPWTIPSGSGKATRETLTRRASCATRASCPPISASRRTGVSCSSAASWATKCSNGT